MSLGIAVVGLLLAAADWTRFRGPDAEGIFPSSDVPASWSAEENVVWKTALPGLRGLQPDHRWATRSS